MFPHTNTSRKFPVKTHCISQSDNLLPEQRTENNHSNMPDGAIISTTSPHENFCLKRTHTILSSTITRIAKNQKIHRIFTLVAFHPESHRGSVGSRARKSCNFSPQNANSNKRPIQDAWSRHAKKKHRTRGNAAKQQARKTQN